MIIDIYTHLAPQTFLDRLGSTSPELNNIARRLLGIKPLFDLDARFVTMDAVADYRQVISLPNPAIEDMCPVGMGLQLARIANDELAAICSRHRDRFAGFAAAVDLRDVESAVGEARRAVRDLGAAGVQIYTNVAGEPLDDSRFRPFFAAMADLDRPIWLHPTRTAKHSDYASESKSRFEMWWCFGWPYDTSVAIARLVLDGLLDRHPDLKVITHHLGGMIPYFAGRVGPGLEVLGNRTTDEDYSEVLSSLKRPHLDYFKSLYADTAMFGAGNALQCGIDFFSADHVVFATDAPLGPIAKTVDAIQAVGLDRKSQLKILSGNAAALLGLDLSA